MDSKVLKNKSLWIDPFLIYPGINHKGLLKKSIVFATQVYAIVLTLIAWAFDIQTLLTFGILSITISFAASIIYTLSIRKNLDWLVLAGMALNIILALYFIIELGGIAHSAGLIMAGLIVVILSTILYEKKWTIWLMALYALTIVAALLWRQQEAMEDLIPVQANNLFFALNAIFAGGLLGAVLIEAFNLQIKFDVADRAKSDRVNELNRIKSVIYSTYASFFYGPLKDIERIAGQTENTGYISTKNKLGQIMSKAGQMIHFTNQMNDLVRIEAGNLRTNKAQGDIIKFTRDVHKTYQQYGKARGIDISLQTNTKQFNLDFDPEKIIHIIGNLLLDAVNRTPKGGVVKLSVNRVQENSFKDCIEFTVSDHGNAIPEDLLSLLIKPFNQRYPASHSEEAQELGLAQTGALVKLLGGSIKAKSKFTKETKIEVQLPAQNASPFKEPGSLLKGLEIIPSYLWTAEMSQDTNDILKNKKVNIPIEQNLSPEHLN